MQGSSICNRWCLVGVWWPLALHFGEQNQLSLDC
jgi:hypothetical protein